MLFFVASLWTGKGGLGGLAEAAKESEALALAGTLAGEAKTSI
jgi:hypothetical protein